MRIRHAIHFTRALLCATLLVPTRATAQGLTAGIEGGLNVANINLSLPDGSLTATPKHKNGLVIGGFIGKDFNAKSGIVIEGLFSQKGTTLKTSTPGYSVSGDVRVNTVEFPVLGRVNLKGSEAATVHIFGGPAFAFKTSDSLTAVENGVTIPDAGSAPITGHDVGIVFGMAVEIHRFLVDARYTWGLMNINAESGSPELKNRVFAVMCGVNFARKK